MPGEIGCDVAIVGAGPVGLVLALLLRRRGWHVEVLERRTDPYPLPRAVHLDHEASRILQAAGVMAELAPLTEAMDAYEWQTAAGETLLRLGAEVTPGRSGWPESAMFHQPDLERILATHLGPDTIHRGWEVVGITEATDSVHLATSAGQGCTARWVVGCDGARSDVGQRVGLRPEDLGYSSDWLVVDVLPDRPRAWHPLNVQVCDPRRPTTAVSGGPGRRRWEFMRLPGEAIEDLDTPTRVWELLAPWGVGPDNATLERHTVYTFAARLLDRWRAGRVALAGDSAHQMPPFAGQGLCSGIRDAASLAWRLDLVLADRAPAGLVDSYGGERAPQVRAVIDFSVALGQIICVSDPDEAAARDRAMTASAQESGPIAPPDPPPVGTGVIRTADPGAGELGRQGVVAHHGRQGLLDDLLTPLASSGWVLLSSVSAPLDEVDEELAGWWAELGGTVVHLAPAGGDEGPGTPKTPGPKTPGPKTPGPKTPGPKTPRPQAPRPATIEVADVGGIYAAWFADLGAAVILQRPDFVVFGTAADGRVVAALLAALRTALSPPTRTG